MKSRLVVLAIGCAALSSCGDVAPLRPASGQSLPPKPAMAQTVPDAEELLERPDYAAPDRVDELMKRSEPRDSDRFDLPPADGSAAPAPPPGTDEDDDPQTSLPESGR